MKEKKRKREEKRRHKDIKQVKREDYLCVHVTEEVLTQRSRTDCYSSCDLKTSLVLAFSFSFSTVTRTHLMDSGDTVIILTGILFLVYKQ